MNSILPFSTNELPTITQVGGKALSLITMLRHGMPVPAGFVLTVNFFEPWMVALQATPAWQAIQNAGPVELGAAAGQLMQLCEDLPYTPQQKNELAGALRTLQTTPSGQFFAVRSSSPEEDLEGASFAGGYETTLGVSQAQLESAILHSFASCFDERVFLYKKEHGFSIHQPRIAVIVQQQVDADSAGVAFSLNPLNNCFDETLINANYGLGDTVVSGAVTPDQFVVERLTHKIIETKIGGNGSMAHLNPNGGTTQTQRPADSGPCLTPTQVLRIAALIDQVETCYQKPIDIEWAFAGEQLYLLQVRPITTYLPLPPEMVTPPGAPKRLYANSTLIEQGLQDPLSVLGTDFLSYVLNKVGGPIAEGAIGPDGITFTAGGGYYMNISFAHMLGMRNAGLAPGSVGDPRVMAILENIDMKQYLGGQLPPKLKAMRGKMVFNILPMATSALMAYLRPAETLRKYQAALPQELRRFETLREDGTSLETQATQLAELLQFFYGDYGIPMIMAAQIAQQRIKNLFKPEAAQVRDHLVNLGVALPGNKTTEMGELMYALASSDEIHCHASASDFLADLAANHLSVEFTQAWQQFMAEFGMRCPGEIDPATPRPYEQPGLLFEQLKDMSFAIRSRNTTVSFFEEACAKREAAYHALLKIALKKGKRQARALENYYKTWTTFGGYRETPKQYVIRVIDLFRRRALKIGQAFVAQGRLNRPEQIFDLTIADIDHAQANLTQNLRELVQERTQLIHKIKRSHQVARIIDSRGKIYAPPRPAATEGELSGVPISPGCARGRVKVFLHARDKQLMPGEILVARATDPGWTPLFINAAGIILEIGGALQHGAVVAREYGIPCVSGLDGATSLLKDGQFVEVDGSNGSVRILAEAEKTSESPL